MKDKRVIAIHLPQFYPFPENDEWWGKGFTEWRNVTMAKPRFRGHYQPHIPSDLGFYDLRLKECRIEQERLAKEYGIDGFCYYHYWFNGHLIMEKPVEAKLANKDEDLPFMFCWANENWHRNWSKGENVTLISHTYSKEDDIKHFQYLLPFFIDNRYIRINNKPVFAIYKSHLVPNIEEMIDTFQTEARKNGFELYICKFESNGNMGSDYMKKGVDSSIDFQPQNRGHYDRGRNPLHSLYKLFGKERYATIDYSGFVNHQINRAPVNYKMFPGVCTTWDNSPRRVGQAFWALTSVTANDFKRWFKYTYDNFVPFSKEENLIFINAWNEWAEGCHLEPDMKYGRAFLNAIKEVISESK